MGEAGDRGRVPERFLKLLALYRKPDGGEWGGKDLERAADDGAVSRSYVTNLKKGRIGSPGLDKLAAIAGAMGFPPALWFGETERDRASDAALMAALDDEAARAILEEVVGMGARERRLLLGIARQISAPSQEMA